MNQIKPAYVVILGFVVFMVLMLAGIAFVRHLKEQKMLAEQSERVQQAETARQVEQAEKVQQAKQAEQARQAEKAQRQAEMDKLEIRCNELQGKWDADPRKNMSLGEVSQEDYKEVAAELIAKDDCWKRAQALKNDMAQQEAEEAAHSPQAEEKMEELRKTWGDELDAQVGYLGLIDPKSLDLFNSNPSLWINRSHLDQYNGYKIQHLKMFMNRKSGTLTILFGCQFIGSSSMPTKMMVRLFDGNGEYLTHFVTEEFFIPPSFHLPESSVSPLSGGIHLQPESNIVQYTVNLRDTAYVQSGEFGLYTGR
jgi:hypothetical protein